MEPYQEDTYGERIAGVYDELYQTYDEHAIARLSDLAQGGRALELGIGTGRIALPLKQRGVDVHGIDISPGMIARLRAKPGGDSIPVTMGNFADVAVEGQFSLIYVLFNTFYALLTQDEQIRCFQNVARHLNRSQNGGVFVVEAFVPDLARYNRQQVISAINISTDKVRLDATRLDPLTQQITSQHIHISEQGIRLYPVKLRYAWPAEIDLMARLAGLRLCDRWASWERTPFTAHSDKHISVYEQSQ
jgi:SAM-dependent methyltransferase